MAQKGSKVSISPSSKETISTIDSQPTKTRETNSPISRDRTHSSKNFSHHSRFRAIENLIVIWLDSTIDQSNQDHQNSIAQLRRIVNSMKTFTDSDQCIDYLTDVTNEKVFLILSESFGQQLMPFIYEITQLASIYVFCGNKLKHSQWAPNCRKVKGVFTQIEALCKELKMDVRLSENNLTPTSIIPNSSTTDLNELDSSFMYSQLLKETLLDDDFDSKQKQKLVDFCRVQYAGNDNGLKIIDEFERSYPRESPIWWYTRDCFVYSMLNKALRTQDIDVIVKMGFILQDIHQQIEQLYSQRNIQEELIVFRGQGMFQPEFDKISKSKGGLLSFNNFLSTSTDRNVSFFYAESASQNPDLVGVLFQINIDSSSSTMSFASLDEVSFFKDQEKEILFSMHTVFRIGETTQIEPRLFQIELISTSDNDSQLQQVKEHIQASLQPPGLDRLASLMYTMGEFDKVEQIYTTLLDTTSSDERGYRAHLHHQLGLNFQEKNDLSNALSHYRQSLDIELTYMSSEHPLLSPTYANIAGILHAQDDLDGALKYFERALNLVLHGSNPNQLDIACLYNHIGAVLQDQNKYDEALKNHESALQILLVHLPSRHPHLAFVYQNLGRLHCEMGNHFSALSHYQEALKIRQRSLPPYHPLLADTHSSLSFAFDSLDRTEEAIEHAVQAVDIGRRSLGSHHPDVEKNQQHLDKLRRKR